jgi:hypothetical protein
MDEWLIPWNDRGRSGPTHDTFLWHTDHLYVMDNHRLALWCWWQHLNKGTRNMDFLHIDRHYDALWDKARPWLKHYKPIHRSSLKDFREATFRIEEDDLDLQLYRWDTIVSALLTLDEDKIHDWIFATEEEGMAPAITTRKYKSPSELPAMLRSTAPVNDEGYPLIVDIDIDYFTHLEDDGSYKQLFSDKYIHELGTALCEGLSDGRFEVVTIALSPTTTGSWQLAEQLCWSLLDKFPCLPILRAGAP